MRVVITGGAGFIGSAVCRHAILQEGWHVLNIDKLTYSANPESLAPIKHDSRYSFAKADICDRPAMDALLAGFAPDAIIHLAAESHVDRSITRSADFIQTNVVGTYSLLEAARTYWGTLASTRKERFRFLHVSTDEVYGSLGPDGLFHEHSPYDPHSPYSASKAGSDHLVRAWHDTYDLPTLISNSSNNYGPHQFPDKLIPLITLNALQGKSLPVYGDGQNIRDWLYVDDHVRALVAVLTQGRVGERYNVGGRSERTNLAIVQTICDLVDEFVPTSRCRRELIAFVADRPGHDRRYAIDCAKIERELAWRPLESCDSGLRKTVQWYLNSPLW